MKARARRKRPAPALSPHTDAAAATVARPYDLVLFDLDGTLVDTAPDIADAVNLALAAHGLPAVSDAWVRDRIGNGTRQLLAQALGDLDGATVEELTESFRRFFAAHCGRRGRLYQDAAGSVALLRRAGVKTVLLTNKETAFTEFVLKVHGLDDDFDLAICGDTLEVKKPDPAVVRHALQRFRVPPQRALLIGDSDIDVRTARNAGIAVWAVSYGYNGGRPIASSNPDRLIRSLRLVADTFLPGPEAG